MPAVASVGVIEEPSAARDGTIRRVAGGGRRLPWDSIFFEDHLGVPLVPQVAGSFATALEMVRLGPSASNRQPWRVVRRGSSYHFLLRRTPGYTSGKLVGIADVQRVDIGIAMCHFELTARELGLTGRWVIRQPVVEPEDRLTEYVVSWEA